MILRLEARVCYYLQTDFSAPVNRTMTYCVTPGCFAPQNPDSARFCLSCGSKLLLKERYRPIQPIGKGGFGRTFLGTDEDIPSKPHCVIKQFHFQGVSSTGLKKAAELFHQEAVRLDELGKHPQIPTLLAHFEQNQRLYLVQEWIAGQTLEQELRRSGAYKEAQIWELLQDLLPVLQYIHDNHVIHRDIKPANIIRRSSPNPSNVLSKGVVSGGVTERGNLVLIDFGVAKLLTDTALLQTGTIIGTPDYMAPEQLKGKVFAPSDLYSLGVTCIYLLTNVSPPQLYDSINDCWVWRDFLPSARQVSDRLGAILDKLLESAVKHRFQSADEVLKALNSTQKAAPLPVQQKGNQGLISAVGIDYKRLRDLLARKKWKEADQLTWELLCYALGKTPGYYLKQSDIEKLPCEDLWTIDQLWVKFSGGHFGFSVQKAIYEDVEGDYASFCDRIGWSLNNSSFQESACKFDLRAPMGHLPSRRWVGGINWWRHASVLATKLEQCGVQ